MSLLRKAEVNLKGISVSTQERVPCLQRDPDGHLSSVMPAACHGRSWCQLHPSLTHPVVLPQTLCFPFPPPSLKEAGAATPAVPMGCLATGMLSDQDPPARFPPGQK